MILCHNPGFLLEIICILAAYNIMCTMCNMYIFVYGIYDRLLLNLISLTNIFPCRDPIYINHHMRALGVWDTVVLEVMGLVRLCISILSASSM